MEIDKNNQKPKRKKRSHSVFETLLDENFFITTKKNKLPEVKTLRKADWMYICLSVDRNKLIKFYCELWDHYVFLRQSKSKPVTAFMDIKWARIKLIVGDKIDNKKVNVIKFSKFRSYEELFHQDVQTTLDWFNELKKVCVLSRFRVYFKSEKVLGKGNFAKVFLVRRNEDGRKFAVKVFDKKLILSDELERKCLLYELQMMRKVKNKNIMRLEELYEGENYIYCLCELLAGGHLLNYIIKNGHLNENDSIKYIKQLLKALEYLESHDIIHRDIKPENILFKSKDKDAELALVDLGFATYVKDFNKLFTRCGTPGYVAPEVLHDKPYNCKADVFSVGVILYIMLTGNVPFASKTYEGLVEANMEGYVDLDLTKFGLDLSDETLDLLASMLEINPEDRPFASQLLKHPVFQNSHLIQGLDRLSHENDGEQSESDLQNFHERYNFNIKQSPGTHAEIPDDLDELNSPIASPMVKFNNKEDGKNFTIFCQAVNDNHGSGN